MTIPTIFREGHAQARGIDRGLADAYVANTTVGDPLADAVVAALAELRPRRRYELVQAVVMLREDQLRDAPREVRTFASHIASPEAAGMRLDPELAQAGSVYFHKHADLFLLSLVGTGMMENFSSLISRSFLSTGYTTQQSVRRMRQSLLQVMESMLPGGLDQRGDGWRLTVRARLVHAQSRRNLLATDDWDPDTYGLPISGAHLAYSMATFSARVLLGVERLGAKPRHGSGREGYMHLWRYIGWLVGVPRELMPANEAEALHLARVGGVCEPPPAADSIIMAHTMANSAGLALGIDDNDDRRRQLTELGYRISRALIGNELADQLEFPKMHTFGLLAALSWKRRLDIVLGRILPQTRRETSPSRLPSLPDFIMMLKATEMRKPAFDFELPDLRHA